MKIYLGSDHAGFKLKETVKVFLEDQGLKVIDQGNLKYQANDDYPFFAHKVASTVASDKSARGILFCGNAQGVCIAANKVKGIRAAVGYSTYGAETSRLDDDSNILCLAGRVLTPKQAKDIAAIWLKTDFSGATRHERRIAQVQQIEEEKWKSVEIIPAILEDSFTRFERKVKKIEQYFPLAQIDVADGKFVNNKTFSDWKLIRTLNTEILFDLHLMMEKPDNYLDTVNSYKKINRVFFHIESDVHPRRFINRVKAKKGRVGVVLNPDTPVRKVKALLKHVDAVQVMGVNPGFYGAKFIKPYSKIKQLRSWNKEIHIVVDGGVKPSNASQLIEAGADALAVGSFLNKHANWKQAVAKLKGF